MVLGFASADPFCFFDSLHNPSPYLFDLFYLACFKAWARLVSKVAHPSALPGILHSVAGTSFMEALERKAQVLAKWMASRRGCGACCAAPRLLGKERGSGTPNRPDGRCPRPGCDCFCHLYPLLHPQEDRQRESAVSGNRSGASTCSLTPSVLIVSPRRTVLLHVSRGACIRGPAAD